MIRQGILVATCMALTACGDPLRDMERLGDLADADSSAAAVVETTPGLAGQIFGPGMLPEDAAVSAALASARTARDEGSAGAGPWRSGLRGLFGRERMTQLASTDALEQEQPPRSLFGGRRSVLPSPAAAQAETVTGPDARRVTAGETVAFGEIARACDLNGRQLGTEVARTSGFRLYDPQPDSSAPRSHYITGFADGCPRQITAAVVLFSDVGTHEVVRYQDSNDRIPYSDVDTAYEAIKARECRVAHGEPCGSRLERLGQDTLFLTVYENFGGNTSWADVLIYDGAVIAMDHKEG